MQEGSSPPVLCIWRFIFILRYQEYTSGIYYEKRVKGSWILADKDSKENMV
jgi:hypothetical protein